MLQEELKNNAYPGRGIIIGRTTEEGCGGLFHHGQK